MRKRIGSLGRRLLIGLMSATLMMSHLTPPVYAAGSPDMDHKVDMAVNMNNSTYKAVLRLYRVAEFQEAHDKKGEHYLSYTATDAFKACTELDFKNVDSTGSDNAAQASLLKNFIDQKNLTADASAASAEGIVKFSDLTPGLYLVMQGGAVTGDNVSFAPVLVHLPLWDKKQWQWDYNVDISAKCSADPLPPPTTEEPTTETPTTEAPTTAPSGGGGGGGGGGSEPTTAPKPTESTAPTEPTQPTEPTSPVGVTEPTVPWETLPAIPTNPDRTPEIPPEQNIIVFTPDNPNTPVYVGPYSEMQLPPGDYVMVTTDDDGFWLNVLGVSIGPDGVPLAVLAMTGDNSIPVVVLGVVTVISGMGLIVLLMKRKKS